MRTKPMTDGLSHTALEVTPHDHHPQPTTVSINNTSQSLPPGTTYNLDITLPSTGYTRAKILIMGPGSSVSGVAWKECAEIVATDDSTEAIAYTVRNTGTFKKVYASTYSKQNGDALLTHKIFDSDTTSGHDYIALKDAWITGSTLRLQFQNFYGGSAYLWVKGQAEVY